MNEETELDAFGHPIPPKKTFAQVLAEKYSMQKDLNFAMHYGTGISKATEQLSKLAETTMYSQEDMKEFVEHHFGVKKEKLGHLFLGGPLHGQRVKTTGSWLHKHPVPVKPNYGGVWGIDPDLPTVAPTLGYIDHTYVMQKVALPGQFYATVFVLQEDLKYMGHGLANEKIGQYLAEFLSDEMTQANTPVMPPKPPPPAPVQLSDGMRITVGGKTIEWTADEGQLLGLLQWAAQSLGPGKEVPK